MDEFKVLTSYQVGRLDALIEQVACRKIPIALVDYDPIPASESLSYLIEDLNACIDTSKQPVVAFILPDRKSTDIVVYGLVRHSWALEALLVTYQWENDAPTHAIWSKALLAGHDSFTIQNMIEDVPLSLAGLCNPYKHFIHKNFVFIHRSLSIIGGWE